MTLPFPSDWNHALVVVAHPDDPEYGMAPAVARWTREGKRVTYILASSGEAGIDSMAPAEAGPLREEEQRRAAAQVGVKTLVWLDLPDSRLAEAPQLTDAIGAAINAHPADLVITTYGGAEFAPGIANQPDHIAVNQALLEALRGSRIPLFENGPEPTHHVLVADEDVHAAIRSLAEHQVYLAVLNPALPVKTQARQQVYSMVARSGVDNRVHFRLLDQREA